VAQDQRSSEIVFPESTSISFEPSGPKAGSEPQLRRAARLRKT
jgi:hypothetical protein